MKKCAYCGRETPDDSSHCGECGTAFIEPAFPAASSSTESPRGATPETVPAEETQCGYCGRLNTSGASRCHECGTPLIAAAAVAAARTVPEPTPAETEVSAPPAVPPDSWSARDAWKCLGMMLVFSLMLSLMSGAAWNLLHWHRGGFSHLCFALADYSINILTALYFARAESWVLFQKAFGLERGTMSYTWFAIVSALLIRAVGHALILSGAGKGVHSGSLWGFNHTFGLERYGYAIPLVILAPLCEEIYMRGFLYRAFRGSYSMELSILLNVVVTAFTHWGQFRESGVAVLGITAMTIVQCYLRERTGRLQDCIVCHFVYNASGLLVSMMR